jgi:hypothetical protein
MIDVQRIDDTRFDVTVEGRVTTHHEVTVDRAYYQHLTGSRVPVEVLVKRSFEFLLQRESNTSILQRFDLHVICSYFPEYEKKIQEVLK